MLVGENTNKREKGRKDLNQNMKHHLLLLLLCSSYTYGQITATNMDTMKLPGQIKYSGRITNAVTWSDSLGINYVLTTETGIYKTIDVDGNNCKNAALYAYHYVTKNDSTKLIWRVYDFEKDCPFDIYVRFMDKAFQVTDLDNNGIAEVWIMYEVQCTSDVSPGSAKIIMYEGSKKYAMRGQNKVIAGADDKGNMQYMGGENKFDKAFAEGPKSFLDYARKLWEKNEMKEW